MINQMILVFLRGAIGTARRETMVLAGMTFQNHYPTAILAENLIAAFLLDSSRHSLEQMVQSKERLNCFITQV